MRKGSTSITEDAVGGGAPMNAVGGGAIAGALGTPPGRKGLISTMMRRSKDSLSKNMMKKPPTNKLKPSSSSLIQQLRTQLPKPSATAARVSEETSFYNTLYVWRKVINFEDFINWAKENGFPSILEPDDLHVTCAFSKSSIDWDKIILDPYSVIVEKSDSRTVESFGPAKVLTIDHPRLHERFQYFKNAGASWDWDEYNPHISISYASDPSCVVPYSGMIVLGPENRKEIDTCEKDHKKEIQLS